MSRAERIAKLERDLAQLRSRLQRIFEEADSGIRDVRELQAAVKNINKKEGDS